MSGQLTPMMRHYLDTKEKYSDCVLFYRLGDFYEMFFDDAVTVSRELQLTLTGKACGLEERAPMCGIPHHASEHQDAERGTRAQALQIHREQAPFLVCPDHSRDFGRLHARLHRILHRR